MSNQTKQRDYLFDNYKAFLILLVVIGHFIEPAYNNNTLLYTLKWLIFSFHMPAFIFISGYFSKRELPFLTLVRKLLVPYVIYELCYYFMYTELLHKDTGLYFLRPKFSLWYIIVEQIIRRCEIFSVNWDLHKDTGLYLLRPKFSLWYIMALFIWSAKLRDKRPVKIHSRKEEWIKDQNSWNAQEIIRHIRTSDQKSGDNR